MCVIKWECKIMCVPCRCQLGSQRVAASQGVRPTLCSSGATATKLWTDGCALQCKAAPLHLYCSLICELWLTFISVYIKGVWIYLAHIQYTVCVWNRIEGLQHDEKSDEPTQNPHNSLIIFSSRSFSLVSFSSIFLVVYSLRVLMFWQCTAVFTEKALNQLHATCSSSNSRQTKSVTSWWSGALALRSKVFPSRCCTDNWTTIRGPGTTKISNFCLFEDFWYASKNYHLNMVRVWFSKSYLKCLIGHNNIVGIFVLSFPP